ncbi:MAG TPA: DUF1003 domain-containing protein [Ideonella sp.]|nr:DUF1003 domain-containing protein [Ideonella sp.]
MKHRGDRYRRARSAEELTEHNVQAMQRLEDEAHRGRGPLDALADRVSAFCGSTPFLWLHVAWFGAWIGGNVGLGGRAFDPYPFTFLTLVVSLEAIFLSSFILISQNRAARVSERRNQLDLQINLLTEQENTKMLELLQRIAGAVGAADHDDPSLEALEQATRPEKLAEQIERAAEAAQGPDAPR